MFTTEMCESEIVNAVQGLFRSCIPESNAWAEPNHLSVTAKVFGGLAFSALSEARNGIDSRIIIQTASGSNLDAIAARPPYNTTRLPATFATGCVDVCFANVLSLAAGDALTREDGATYTVCCDVTLDADGCGEVEVKADVAGPDGNAAFGYPFNDARGTATVCKSGIGAGHDVECDDDLKDRLFSLQPGCQFGSIKSIEACALGVQGIQYAKACEGLGGINLYVGTKTGPIPTQVEIEEVQAVFDDPCKKLIGTCVTVRGISACELRVELTDPCPASVSAVDVSAYLSEWVLTLPAGTPVSSRDVERALVNEYRGIDWRVQNGPFDLSSGCAFTTALAFFV